MDIEFRFQYCELNKFAFYILPNVGHVVTGTKINSESSLDTDSKIPTYKNAMY